MAVAADWPIIGRDRVGGEAKCKKNRGSSKPLEALGIGGGWAGKLGREGQTHTPPDGRTSSCVMNRSPGSSRTSGACTHHKLGAVCHSHQSLAQTAR